jgi:hypothetical protein
MCGGGTNFGRGDESRRGVDPAAVLVSDVEVVADASGADLDETSIRG